MQVGGPTGVSGINVASMDIETALMMVQSRRTELLESQLKGQIEQVSQRNDRISKMNALMSELSSVNAQFGSKASNTTKVNAKSKDGGIDNWNSKISSSNIQNMANAAGVNLESMKVLSGGSIGNATKGDIDVAIQKIKGMIDAESNSQQMDMLRLQSLSNKRNEAFDLMTNFVKKMHDGRASIVANMR